MSGEQHAERPPNVSRLDPPRKVWVVLRQLLPPAPNAGYENVVGLDVTHDVPGVATECALTSHGGRLYLVTYQIYMEGEDWGVVVEHYVPGHMLKPRGRRSKGRRLG